MINKGKLEELLVRNWTSFFDTKKLIVKVLKDVEVSEETFATSTCDRKCDKNSMQVSLSRFHLEDSGFVLWVEFVVPRNEAVSVGTVEYKLNNDSSLELRQMMGTKFTMSR
jgi:hypothetical protein